MVSILSIFKHTNPNAQHTTEALAGAEARAAAQAALVAKLEEDLARSTMTPLMVPAVACEFKVLVGFSVWGLAVCLAVVVRDAVETLVCRCTDRSLSTRTPSH